MRKVVVLVWLIVLCGAAWGMEYPAIGTCNGQNIRLREFPGPKGKVAGQVNTGMELVVLGETKAAGQTWYKVDHPARKGNVWIPAEYVLFKGGDIEEIFVRVRLTLGINQDKARAILGSPTNWGRSSFEYPGLKIWYDFVGLQRAEVSSSEYSLGGVNVGDNPDKLEALGMPKGWEKGRDSWTLKGITGEEMSFTFDGGRIASMSWKRPMNNGVM